MKLTKGHYIALFSTIAAGTLTILFWPKKEKCPNGKPTPEDGDCTKVMNKTEVENYKKTGDVKKSTGGTPTPIDGGVTQNGKCIQPIGYVPETFPYKKGMEGSDIKEVQTKLGGLKIDGQFGCKTEAKLLKEYGVTSINQSMFLTIVNE